MVGKLIGDIAEAIGFKTNCDETESTFESISDSRHSWTRSNGERICYVSYGKWMAKGEITMPKRIEGAIPVRLYY